MESIIDQAPSGDANTVPPRQTIFFFRYEVKTLNTSQPLYASCSTLQYKKFSAISLSFTNIYKCHNMTFIDEVCWPINLDRKACFSVYHTNLFSIMWHVLSIVLFVLFGSRTFLILCTASSPSYFLTIILYPSMITFSPKAWLFFWCIINFAT